MTCDWSEFQAVAHRGLAVGTAGVDDLRAALGLARDRPLLGVPDSSYTWAEYDIQHMISTISDIAHVLARQQDDMGDHRGAVLTATKGLQVDACSDLPYEVAISAAQQTGDLDECARLQQIKMQVLRHLDPDAEMPPAISEPASTRA